jgi:hypothetical protein
MNDIESVAVEHSKYDVIINKWKHEIKPVHYLTAQILDKISDIYKKLQINTGKKYAPKYIGKAIREQTIGTTVTPPKLQDLEDILKPYIKGGKPKNKTNQSRKRTNQSGKRTNQSRKRTNQSRKRTNQSRKRTNQSRKRTNQSRKKLRVN